MTDDFMVDLPDIALSVRQPWAWAIIYGGKDIENRVRRAITLGGMDRHRRLAIHASSGMTRSEYDDAAEFMETLEVACPPPSELVRGAIIGSVSIVGITKQSASPWFFGPWGLELADAQACETIPCAGQLGAFRWRANVTDAAREPLPWMLQWPAKPGRIPRPEEMARLL